MRYCCVCLNSNCCIYTSLIGNILINILVLAILIIICYNITILNVLQQMYLIASIIIWLILIIYYIYKLIFIFLGKYSDEYYQKKIWKFVHFPPYIIIAIALIYDLVRVPFKSGSVGWLLYYILFFIICVFFVILCNFDFFGIRKQVELSNSKKKTYPLKEEKEMKDITDLNKSDKKLN